MGLSIGLYDNGRTYFYHFGLTGQSAAERPTTDTRYEIGSITKTFTSYLLAQAVRDKKLRLSDDIRDYLDGQYPNLEYAGQPIRLVHLANTSSGLPDNLPDLPNLFQQKKSPDSLTATFIRLHQGYTRPQFYADLHYVKLTRPPGSQPHHSNVAAQLLSYILERVYRQSYEELLQHYILGPARMASTSLATAVPVAGASRLAKGYDQDNHVTPYLTLPDLQAAGGLVATPADMVRYLQFQLAPQNAVARLTHQLTRGHLEEEAHGLSWFITTTADGKRALAHSGGTFGFASYCAFYPDLNRGIVLLANKNDGATESRLADVAAALLASTYGLPAGLRVFRTELAKRGYQNALRLFKIIRQQHPELFLSEDYVNRWGYALLGQGKKREAIGVFELNVGLYPTSANSYDSLGEAYQANGEQEQAIKNFKRSLELNPANTNAVEQLKTLGVGVQ